MVSQQGKEAVVAILEQGSARGEARLVGGSAGRPAVGVAEAGPISDPWRSDAFLTLLLTSHKAPTSLRSDVNASDFAVDMPKIDF